MANSPSNQPIRSISLPTRPHPLVPQIDEQLSRLRSLEEVSSISLSRSSSLAHKLSHLVDLYDCLDDIFLLPQNQQKLAQFSDAKCVDELLDGSLRLLDACGTAKDVLSQVKERTQEVQSSLRRRCSGEYLSIGDEVVKFTSMRKKTKLMTKVCMKDVKGLVKRFASQVENDGNFAMIDALRKVQGVTAEIFESLLDVISGSSKAQSCKRSTSLSIIMCKLRMHQNLAYEKEEVVSDNEFEDVDSTLSSLIIAQKKKACINVLQAENLRNQLVKLDSSVQDLDEVLEGLFRCLVRSRVSLLNFLSQ